MVCLGFLGLFGSAAPPAAGTGGDVEVQGHRGARGLLPENTLAGFARALELGVDALELDLHVTRDRVLAVYHDPALDRRRCRMDDGSPMPKALLRDLDFADLARVDCGSLPSRAFPDQQRIPGARIPRVEEVFDLARAAPYPVRLNVEIKMRKPRKTVARDLFADLVVDAVRASGLADRITVQSFDAEVLRMVGERAPELPLSMVVVHRRHYDERLAVSGARMLSPRHQQLRRKDVIRCRERGIKILPWTVNEEADIRRLMSWGVDAIITDYPDRALALRSDARAE